MWLPVFMLLICVLGAVGTFFYMRFDKRKRKETVSATEKTANEFVNVRDIRGNLLYTRDNHALCFLRISPISIELFSKSEKKTITRLLTAELSTTQFPFQFIAVSRPVDISPLITELTALLQTDDPKQKELLKMEISEMNMFAISGEVVERQFYILLWDKVDDDIQRDLVNKARLFSSKFTECGVSCELLSQHEIVRLCNLVNNPYYAHLETADMDATIPMINGMGV